MRETAGVTAQPNEDVWSELASLGVATLHEAAGRIGVCDPAIRSVARSDRLAGPALTVRCRVGDNLAIHRALANARPGDVLVVDAAGHLAGYFGELMAVAAQARGVAGLVIDGGVRDAAQLRALHFPVWSRGLCVLGCTKLDRGALGEPVACGGTVVRAGDAVIADGDGVVFLPRERLDEILAAARERAAREVEYVRRLAAGETTIEVLGLPEG